MTPSPTGTLFAISDLHVGHKENHEFVERLRPESDQDWLIVAGDVAERTVEIEWALRQLAERFATVLWVPGNHDLWTTVKDPVQLHGLQRYQHLIALCREIGVHTPEDPYPVWQGADGPVAVAPLFCLYDYTFRTPTAHNKEQALAQAREAGVVCTDEYMLFPDPYPTRDAWCAARIDYTERRLAECDPEVPLVLVNHWPLNREPTMVLRYPEFAQWCGSVRTGDWHRRFNVAAVVYGHLHIPRTTWHDGVRFEEVSVGYPREWSRPRHPNPALRRILPV